VAGRCNASQDAQDAWNAGDASLASGRNADGSDAGSVFADVIVKAGERICCALSPVGIYLASISKSYSVAKSKHRRRTFIVVPLIVLFSKP